MKAFSISLFRSVVCSALVFAATCTLTVATPQTAEKKAAPEEEQKRQKELERKTLVLLDEIVSTASSLKLPENRIFVLVSSANLMWSHDEKRARNIFWEAINALNVIRPIKQSPGSDKSNNAAYFETFGWRREILRVVAERDAEFALELLQASRQTPPESINSEGIFATERQLEQEIAAMSADNDPKRALQLARESLSKGLSVELINLLFQINQKDSELGSKFAGEVVDKIKAGGLDTDRNASFVAIQLLTASRTPTDAPQLQAGSATNRITLAKEERRALVELLADAVLSVSANPMLLSISGEIMPEIEEFFPERVLLLKRKLGEFQQRMPQRAKNQEKYNSLVRSGVPEDILNASLTGTEEERFWLEREAIISAVFSQKTESLREFITNQVDDESRRKRMLDSLDSEEIDFASHQGDSEALKKLLPKIRLKEQRARAMAQMAIQLEARGDHDAAVNLLDECAALIKVDLQSQTKSDALLTLMAAYALVDPSRAFAIAERTIDRANDEVSKALLLDKFIKSGMVKKGEIILHHSGSFPMDFAMLKYGKGVAALAAADFGRTKAAADRFERHELRIYARLLIAQALLGKKPNAILLKLH